MDRHWAERDIEALLGVYALDALGADERAVVDPPSRRRPVIRPGPPLRRATSGTCCSLRAHDAPDVTAFLSFGVYEEVWHAEAIADVLTGHREPPAKQRIAALRGLPGRRRPHRASTASPGSAGCTFWRRPSADRHRG